MPTPIQTVGYFKYMQPWFQAIGQGAKNAYQAGKIGTNNVIKRLTHSPIQQKFTPKTFDEILSKVPSTDDAFIKALDTYRGASTGAPVTFKELQEMAAWAKSHPQGSKSLEEIVANYIKNSGVDAAGLHGIGLTNQATKWNALTNALQPGHTLKFDPLTRTLQAVDGTGQAIRRFSPLKTSLVTAGTGGTIWGGIEGVGAISDYLAEKDMTPAEYIASVGGNADYKPGSNEPVTVDAPVTDTPQTTENLPKPDQAPTPPVSAAETPASAKPEVPAEIPAAPATPAADPSFVDKALQWGKDNPDLVSLLSLLAVGAGGVGLYSLLDDDDEEEDEEEEY